MKTKKHTNKTSKIKYKHPYLSQAMCKTTFYTLGVKQAKTGLNVVYKGIKHRGARDTAQRLKKIMIAVNLLLDEQYAESEALLNSLRLSGKSKDLSVIRIIHNSLKYCKSDIKASRLYTVLKLYTGIDYDVSDDDKRALLQPIVDNFSNNLSKVDIRSTMRELLRNRNSIEQTTFDIALLRSLLLHNTHQAYQQPDGYLTFNDSQTIVTDIFALNNNKARYRVAPTILDKGVESSKSADSKLALDLLSGVRLDHRIKFRDKTLGSLDGILEMARLNISKTHRGTGPSAELVIIPKPGADGRVIAKLPLIQQLSLISYHQLLDSVRERFQVFSGKDQKDMADFAKQNKSYSTDLSSATDRIPRLIIEEYLYHLVDKYYESMYQEYVVVDNTGCELDKEEFRLELRERVYIFYKFIDDISKQKFVTPFGSTISYSVGQPMGMYTSFPWLDICNYLLASSADPTDRLFKIVGDDIVFISNKAMQTYMDNCTSMGIELSRAKTYSNKFAQAVGREIYNQQGAALPLKFSNHKFIRAKEFEMGYGALYPKLTKFSKEKLRNCRTQWRNATFVFDERSLGNRGNFNKEAFKNNFINLLNSLSRKLDDLRLVNSRPRTLSGDMSSDQLRQAMLANSKHIIDKLIALENKRNTAQSNEKFSLYDSEVRKKAESEYLEPTKLKATIPHTLQDRNVSGGSHSPVKRSRR